MCSEVHCALDLNMCGRALGAHTVWSDPLASPRHSCVRDAIFYLLLSPDIQTLIIIICQLNFRVLIETIYGIFEQTIVFCLQLKSTLCVHLKWQNKLFTLHTMRIQNNNWKLILSFFNDNQQLISMIVRKYT